MKPNFPIAGKSACSFAVSQLDSNQHQAERSLIRFIQSNQGATTASIRQSLYATADLPTSIQNTNRLIHSVGLFICSPSDYDIDADLWRWFVVELPHIEQVRLSA